MFLTIFGSHERGSPESDMEMLIEPETRVSYGRLSGVTVEIVDYRWPANCRVTSSESDITVRWRLWPNRVSMTAGMGDQQQSRIGRLMIHKPNTPYSSVAKQGSGSVTLLQCRFSRAWLMNQLGENFWTLDAYLASSMDVRNDNIDFLMRRIAQEMTHPDADSVGLIEAAVTMLGVELVRHARAVRSENDNHERYSHRVSEIRAMVTTGDDVLTIAELSERFNLSNSQLRRIFKDECGVPLQKYIDQDRMHRARKLLGGTQMRLKQIAYMLGYRQPSGFSCAFKAATGTTPIEYRRRSLEGVIDEELYEAGSQRLLS
jgi:AraC family transcriptional regulator